jgi:hypothetical protein
MDGKFAEVDKRFVEMKKDMDGKFAEVDKRFVEMKKDMDGKFAEVDKRFVEAKKDTDARFGLVDKSFKAINRELRKMNKKLDLVVKSFDNDIIDHELRITRLEERVTLHSSIN